MTKLVRIAMLAVLATTVAVAGQTGKKAIPTVKRTAKKTALLPRPISKPRPLASPLLPTPQRYRMAGMILSSPIRPGSRSLTSIFGVLSTPVLPSMYAATHSTLGLSSPLLPSARIVRTSQQTQQTTAAMPVGAKPVLVIMPADTTLTLDARGFASAKIRFRNAGGGKLSIARITPSCGCASASVQRNTIDSTGTGMFLIGVNGKNVTDVSDVVEWVIESNAAVPSVPYRVRIKKP
ncbi:MAG: DUF1573 domain-containing protein [Candidatus Kapabacteria bacterium]|nr:DUF1573 domain-containing protein [Candidatus Kapabacteria bacterium]